MQDDKRQAKKKKRKEFLTKLLIFLVLLGISIATYNYNLPQMFHDFMMRFFTLSGSNMGTVVEASELPNMYIYNTGSNSLKSIVNNMIEDTDGKTVSEKEIENLSDNINLLSQSNDIDCGAFISWLEEYKYSKESSIIFNEQFKCMNVSPLKAWCFVEIENIEKSNEVVYINMYEWTFLKYSTNGCEDIMGYGLNHILTLYDGEIYDYYEDEFMSDITDSKKTISAAAYDVNKAVDYSDKYATSYNPSYSNYNSIGGDCANYVSQCLYAGGIPMTDGWYWKSYDDRSASWSYCPSQVNYFTGAGYKLIDNPSDAQVIKGNPVYYYSASSNRYSHAAICVGVNSAGVPVVNAHNNDHYHVPWQLGSNWAKRSTIIISDLAADTNAPVISNIKINNVSNQGFSVTMNVSDNVGVSKVLVPVWTVNKGQDDIVWHEAVIKDGIASCNINASSHGYEGGIYIVNIYAYDAAGNQGYADGGTVNVDRSIPGGTKKGDVTLDGKIDLLDAKYVLQLAIGIYRIDDIYAADINNDGKVNLIDAKAVLKMAVGIK